MITPRERFGNLANKWFISEPALFAVYCTHNVEENTRIQSGIRSGQGRIEYNPDQVNLMSDPEFEQRVKTELIRLCLRHPYERQPIGCAPIALHMGSDMVISPAYDFPLVSLAKPEDMDLLVGQRFEWYADAINEKLKQTKTDQNSDDSGSQKTNKSESEEVDQQSGQTDGSSGSTGDTSVEHKPKAHASEQDIQDAQGDESDASGEESDNNPQGIPFYEDDYTGLWQEDEERLEQIKEVIQSINEWGTIPGSMVEVIQKALEGTIDYRKVLRAFQTSVISTNRTFTRMRPNRRFEFEYMGSKHDLSSKLLVAVDVSGSVSNEALSKFFRIIGNFFKYGVDAIDVIQFDAQVADNVMDLKTGCKEIKASKIQIYGRGGTNFQCVFDYLREHNQYDGLVIFSDGYAPEPKVEFHTRAKILWVTETEDEYNQGKDWMKRTGRACFIK